jgi:hypothetical protein
MTPGEEELADRLRRALRAEADQVMPVGDGLVRIRERVDHRRRRLSWLRPVLLVTAAAGVASVAVAAPALLRELGHRRPAPTGAAASLGTASSSPSVTVLESRVGASRTLPPESGVSDMRTVWPYASRAEGYYAARGDVSTGKHPELTDAARAAVTFVQQYVGPRVTLSAGRTTAQDRGVGVVVNRRLANGASHPVTRVYLVPVSGDSGAPYVVAGAQRPGLAGDGVMLSLAPPAEPVQSGDDHITVSGTIRRPGATGPPSVQVEVGDAGGATLSFNRAVPKASGTEPDTFTWTASINLEPGAVLRAVTLAAWTLDDDAGVLEFVAAPVPLRSGASGGPSASAGPSDAPEPSSTPDPPGTTDPSPTPAGTPAPSAPPR